MSARPSAEISHRSKEAVPASSRSGVEAEEMRELRREAMRVRTSETVEVEETATRSVMLEIAARRGGRGFGEERCAL